MCPLRDRARHRRYSVSCCDTYYPVTAVADHDIQEYLGGTACPACETRFNPGCADHYDRYVETMADAAQDA